jgi:hypothetical protein
LSPLFVDFHGSPNWRSFEASTFTPSTVWHWKLDAALIRGRGVPFHLAFGCDASTALAALASLQARSRGVSSAADWPAAVALLELFNSC